MPGNRLDVTADWYTRAGDTASTMTATLTDATGTAVNLTGATISFQAYGPGADVVVAASSSSPTTGVVTVTPTFTEAGVYYGRFVVTFSGGGIQTFPSASDIEILVRGPE